MTEELLIEEIPHIEASTMELVETYKNGSEYEAEGYKVADLWTVGNRTISSYDLLSANGGLTQGRIDIDWLFWKDSNIKPFRYILTLDNGSEFEGQTLQEVIRSLQPKYDPQFTDGGCVIEFDMHSDEVGVVKLQLVYINENDWIRVAETTSTVSGATIKLKPNTKLFKLFFETQDRPIIGYVTIDLDYPVVHLSKNTYVSIGDIDIRILFTSADTIEVSPTKSAYTFKHIYLKYL